MDRAAVGMRVADPVEVSTSINVLSMGLLMNR